MAVIDHIVYACADLTWGRAFLATLTGVNPSMGGPHPGVGTHNALMALGDETYLEIIAKDPDQPEPGRPRPFALDDGHPARVATFAVHAAPDETIEQIAKSMASLGFDPGPVRSMSRKTPAGDLLEWQLTSAPNRPVPFLIDWGEAANPASTSPTGCGLAKLHCVWPDPPQLRELHAMLGIESVVRKGQADLWVDLDSRNEGVELR